MPSVSRDEGFAVYRVRGGHGDDEWATIAIREWRRDATRLSGGEARECGEILIYSSFGSWAHQWGHLGTPFRRWLLKCDFHYVFTKFMGTNLGVYDGEATLREIKRKLLDERRQGWIKKDLTRELWDELDGSSGEIETSERDMVESVQRIKGDFADNHRDYSGRTYPYPVEYQAERITELLDEPWNFICKKHDPQAIGFWRDIWPVFIDAIRAELAEAVAA